MPSKLSFVVLILFFCQSLSVAQDEMPIMPSGHFVILGAFAIPQNALAYEENIQQSGLAVKSGFVPSRNLYYVYLDMSRGIEACLQQVKITRQDARFTDAWVRWVDDETAVKQPVVTQAIAEPEKTTEPQAEPVMVQQEPVVEEEPIQFLTDPSLGQVEVFLSLYNESNDRVVEGKVRVVDGERGRLLSEVPGNSYLMLPNPKSKSGKVVLICEAFGYRKVQHEIDFAKPYTDSTAFFIDDMGTSLVIKFPLIRYGKGDIHTLYNVYFYNDAAVFLPESKFELNELLVMMRESETSRIRLHGHTNGSYHGKIIRVGPSKNFFSITQDVRTGKGTAKELSESRAEVIKDYLVDNGIDASRIEVKAWGGKKPLYDKHNANAKKNIRVEVEVLAL
jgi:outer membrane protein OmpA-like peptidoglycan-associated protein